MSTSGIKGVFNYVNRYDLIKGN